MSYVTRGNVQVELKTGTKDKIYIRINPVQGYAVKHEKNDWIVFINDDSDVHSLEVTVLAAQLFKKTHVFTTSDSRFVQPLLDSALKQSVIEIKIKKPDSFEIESIKIPALLGSETA